MSAALYREIVLHGPTQWTAALAFIKGNAKTQNDLGKPLRLIITAEDEKRNDQQNRFYWGAVLRAISEQSWVAGRQYDKDTWHEYFARLYGVCEDVTLPDGEVITRRKSTTAMTVKEFSEYLDQIQSHAASQLGVLFS
jgi:hypothetical protein